MRALQAIVITMGVLIVIGVGLLIYGVATGQGSQDRTERGTGALAGFGSLALGQPDGTRIVQMTEAGSGLLVLRLQGGGPDRVAVVDPRRGRLVGIIHVATAPESVIPTPGVAE